MTRLLQISLLLMALMGLIGQSTAMAMAPSAVASNGRTATAMAGMDCAGMSGPETPGQPPCKKVTLQCIAVMGCSPLTFTDPFARSIVIVQPGKPMTAVGPMAHFFGRDYGPEPKPPIFLI